MNLDTLKDSPPWDWPQDTGKELLEILRNRESRKEERMLAGELAGDYTVVNEEIAATLLSIVRGGDETDDIRNTAVIALGPALEHAVCAAGNWEIDAAWSRIEALLSADPDASGA